MADTHEQSIPDKTSSPNQGIKIVTDLPKEEDIEAQQIPNPVIDDGGGSGNLNIPLLPSGDDEDQTGDNRAHLQRGEGWTNYGYPLSVAILANAAIEISGWHGRVLEPEDWVFLIATGIGILACYGTEVLHRYFPSGNWSSFLLAVFHAAAATAAVACLVFGVLRRGGGDGSDR